ncbi:MAG: glycosyltransferase [Hyphomicrobiaceae bacterium]
MTAFEWLLIGFGVTATALHLGSVAIAMLRCREGASRPPPGGGAPSVSILRPICGLDRYDEVTLRSGFSLDYPNFAMIFCCADAGDPAAHLVRRLIDANPHVRASLLIGNHAISANPKLNNLVKGWQVAGGDWIIFADSNVLMPRDYVQRLLLGWRRDTGILCSPPIGCRPEGFGAVLECAFLNTYQARWQYAADSLGFGFAQGKTMLMRRGELARAGGIHALAAEIAEDAAATKIVRGLGLDAALVDAPFRQPLGARTLKQVWDRQARWARMRRMAFPGCFAVEVLTGCLLPLAALAYVGAANDLPTETVLAGVAGLATVWLGAEAVLARAAGWHLSWQSPFAWMLRDVLLPFVWAHAWVTDSYAWRGNEISTAESGARAG